LHQLHEIARSVVHDENPEAHFAVGHSWCCRAQGVWLGEDPLLKLSFPEALADSAAYIHYETNLHRFLTVVIWPVGMYASMSASAKKFTTPSAPSGSSPQ
jgi:hypothetical protein